MFVFRQLSKGRILRSWLNWSAIKTWITYPSNRLVLGTKMKRENIPILPIFDNKIQVFQFEKFTKNGAGNFLSLSFL